MILVTGGTGKIGVDLVKQLAPSGQKVRVMVRNPDKVQKAANIEAVKGDFGDIKSIEAALPGVEKVFFLSPSEPGISPKNKAAIDAFKKAGVKHVVRLSVMGAELGSKVQLMNWHAETERDLKSSGLTWTFLQPTFFMQNHLGSASSIKKDGAMYGCYRDGAACPIDARDIATAGVKVLTSSGHEGKAYPLTGPDALSWPQQAEKIGKAIGKAVRYVDLTPEQFKGGLTSAGLPEWLANDYIGMAQAVAAGNANKVSPELKTLIGSVRTFDAFCKDFVAVFK